MAYNHGVRIQENPTSLPAPVIGTAGLQVVLGTAPVNLAEDPYKAANRPIIAESFEEAKKAMGYSDDFKSYTLCQSMDASFRVFGVAPVVMITVLDPKKHTTAIEEQTCEVKDGQAVVDVQGILLDKMTVKNGDVVLGPDVDYVAVFDAKGRVVINLIQTGDPTVTSLKISGTRIDPSKVKTEDIIGGYDVASGAETGLELIRQVYPLTGHVPGIIIVPGYSKEPSVAAAMAAKCIGINGTFTCEAVVDLDCTSSGASKYSDVKAAKEKAMLVSPHMEAVWPKVRIMEKVYYFSSIYAAMIAYADVENDDVPSIASNRTLPITGLCLDDDAETEVVLDQERANEINGCGVVTAINLNGFKSWGNNTVAYPDVTDPKDRWFNCRRFFSWWGNNFILNYSRKVDNPANYRLIQAICDEENIRGNSYVAQGKCAGARITYSQEDNPISQILDGKIQFKQYLAPFTPAEDILNILEFDPSMLEAAMSGGEA